MTIMSDAEPITSTQRRPPPLFWILVGVLIVLALLGVGSIAYYIKLTYGPPSALWESPWDMPEPQRISAGLAVWSLTGAPPELVYRQALATNELDTATALTLLTPNLPANQRLGWTNALAHRFITDGRTSDAFVMLQYTADLAMVLPDLPDYLRAQILIKAADGWAELGDKEKADWALSQALVIAQFSPELSPSLRKNLFNDIGERTIALGDAARGQAISAIPVLNYTITPPQPFPLDPILQKPLIYPEGVANLQREREQSAQLYVDDWSQRGGEAAAGVAMSLAARLIDEDLGRQVYYQNQYARKDLAGDDRARVVYDQVEWEAIKYRAASGLYGAPLVGEWVEKRPDIGIELRNSIAALHNEMNDYVATLPQDKRQAGKVAMDRLIMGWTVIGLYVGANLDVVTDDLNKDIADWDAVGVFPRARVRGDRIEIELFYKSPLPNEG